MHRPSPNILYHFTLLHAQLFAFAHKFQLNQLVNMSASQLQLQTTLTEKKMKNAMRDVDIVVVVLLHESALRHA
jgi:hypothetical protein